MSHFALICNNPRIVTTILLNVTTLFIKPCRLARFLLYMAPPLFCDGGLLSCPLPKNRHLFDLPILARSLQNHACGQKLQTVDHPPALY